MKISKKNLLETFLRSLSALVIILSFFILACSSHHLINDRQYLALTDKAFAEKKLLAIDRDSALFSVFNKNLSTEQSEALKFLFAFMPLNDLADYNGDFFLADVNLSLKARAETKWGMDIPEEVFLHYVLPPRVNNENLDSFRIVYYDEIMNRIKGKDLKEAALELNHWCHEKVNYQPADDRTSAPMSTILSARGRCGEESTFTVATLRTAGIPSRQVYTPRWAHTDDNHAWVEIWYNGKWNYMGACEPEPVLNRGWFTEPARRAMLVHTKSFGAFSGKENIVRKYTNYTDVNNLSEYAVTKKITVKVLDEENIPVRDAQVEYQLYNYAEFYPLAVVPTDEHGISQFETGLGDLLIWAHKGDSFDFKKISVGETDTLILKTGQKEPSGKTIDLDLDVPVILAPLKGPDQDLIEQNTRRINRENDIRQKYIDSWMKPAEAKNLALRLNIDTGRIKKIIARSMGNYKEISAFLSEAPDTLLPLAMSLLEVLPDKDLRDTKKNILSDHLGNIVFYGDASDNEKKLFLEYILNPRVENEKLVAYRKYFLTKLPSQLVKNGSANPLLIVQYLDDHIRIAEEENYYRTPLTPVGVDELKVSDQDSRAICFVAICRSLGIPSRLEPGRKVPQYYFNDNWNDVCFSDQTKPDLKKAYLKLGSTDTKPVPEYYIQFTIARFEGGRYNTLEYDFNKKITDFKEELSLPPGHYMLVTGNRLSNGKILSEITFFDLAENEHKALEVNIRKDVSGKKILGKIDMSMIYDLCGVKDIARSCSSGKGSVIIWIDPEKEPTKHIFNDLPFFKTEFDAWGGQFIFLYDGNDQAVNGRDHSLKQNGNKFNPEIIKNLPVNTSFGVDYQMSVLKKSLNLNSASDLNLPVVVVTDNTGNIFFISAGYRIGIGEQILKYIQ